jgi:drug/metabolite transporter (DMT)-like permease
LKLSRRDYLVGALLALATAACLSAQEVLSGPAARKLTGAQFVFVTEIALLAAAPMLLWRRDSRRDFWLIVSSAKGRWRLLGLTAVGLAGLTLYNLGLRDAHPVVVTAILNLSPFWAALAARVVAGVRIPVAPAVFALSLVVALAGTLAVAYSQAPPGASNLSAMLTKGSWYFAIPVPLFTALSGTLVGLWFADRRDEAAIAAALVAPALALIPAIALYLMVRDGFAIDLQSAALLAAGAITAAGFGRLLYQFALTRTGEDNGFVTMFFLLGPALAGLYSWLLSGWLASARFAANGAFFLGLVVTAGALLFFAVRARRATAKEPTQAP